MERSGCSRVPSHDDDDVLMETETRWAPENEERRRGEEQDHSAEDFPFKRSLRFWSYLLCLVINLLAGKERSLHFPSESCRVPPTGDEKEGRRTRYCLLPPTTTAGDSQRLESPVPAPFHPQAHARTRDFHPNIHLGLGLFSLCLSWLCALSFGYILPPSIVRNQAHIATIFLSHAAKTRARCTLSKHAPLDLTRVLRPSYRPHPLPGLLFIFLSPVWNATAEPQS